MSEITVKTNNVPRNIMSFFEFSEKEQAELLDEFSGTGDPVEFCEGAMWVRYQGQIHCLSEFLRIDHHPDGEFSRWEGYASDSYFSGLVCRFVDDGERVIIGRYYS